MSRTATLRKPYTAADVLVPTRIITDTTPRARSPHPRRRTACGRNICSTTLQDRRHVRQPFDTSHLGLCNRPHAGERDRRREPGRIDDRRRTHHGCGDSVRRLARIHDASAQTDQISDRLENAAWMLPPRLDFCRLPWTYGSRGRCGGACARLRTTCAFDRPQRGTVTRTPRGALHRYGDRRHLESRNAITASTRR
jgi:hypothetical protein